MSDYFTNILPDPYIPGTAITPVNPFTGTCIAGIMNEFSFRYQLTAPQFTYAINYMVPLLGITPYGYKDTPSIVTYGLPSLTTLYSLMGISNTDAAKTSLALLRVSSLAGATGITFVDRGLYLQRIGLLLQQIYAPNNAIYVANMPISLPSIKLLPHGQRFSALLSALAMVRINKLDQFNAFLGVFPQIPHLLDNFLAFESVRLSLQTGLVSTPNPLPLAQIHIDASFSILDFTLLSELLVSELIPSYSLVANGLLIASPILGTPALASYQTVTYISATNAYTGSASSLNIPAPPGVANGNGLLAFVSCLSVYAPTASVTPPSGWALVHSVTTDLPDTYGTYLSVYVYKKVASSEPSYYTWLVSTPYEGSFSVDIRAYKDTLNSAGFVSSYVSSYVDNNTLDIVNDITIPAFTDTYIPGELIVYFVASNSASYVTSSPLLVDVVLGVWDTVAGDYQSDVLPGAESIILSGDSFSIVGAIVGFGIKLIP